MAPEQWSGASVDGRLDQYALGIVLYEIIAGSHPFQGDSYEALYVQHRESPLPPLPENLRVPNVVESVIRKAVEKDPDSRFASTGDMVAALEDAAAETSQAQTEVGAGSFPYGPRQTSTGKMAGGTRSGRFPSWWLFGGAGIAVVAMIAAIIATFLGGNGDPSKRSEHFQMRLPPRRSVRVLYQRHFRRS